MQAAYSLYTIRHFPSPTASSLPMLLLLWTKQKLNTEKEVEVERNKSTRWRKKKENSQVHLATAASSLKQGRAGGENKG